MERKCVEVYNAEEAVKTILEFAKDDIEEDEYYLDIHPAEFVLPKGEVLKILDVFYYEFKGGDKYPLVSIPFKGSLEELKSVFERRGLDAEIVTDYLGYHSWLEVRHRRVVKFS